MAHTCWHADPLAVQPSKSMSSRLAACTAALLIAINGYATHIWPDAELTDLCLGKHVHTPCLCKAEQGLLGACCIMQTF